MKRGLLIALMAGIVSSAWAQHDDLYFVPKKKKVQAEVVDEPKEEPQEAAMVSDDKALSITTINIKGLDIDEDAYNRRGSYLTEEGDAVSELAMDDEGFVLITEEGDTLLMNTDTLRLTHLEDGEGWINGFDGSNSDYEYAMRIVRFRNPRYAIPVSSPLYWDVVYGGALWPSWQWNIYDDGMYAYVFPTSSNWYYSDYIMGYPYGWGGHWNYSWGYHWGGYWTYAGYHFGHVWYDPWYNPYFYDYYPGWHYGHHHHHHGYHPGPGWGGVTVGPRPIHNDRHADIASTRRGLQSDNTVGRGAASTSRQSTTATRAGSGSITRSSSVRVVTGRSGSTQSSGAVRSSSSRSGSDEVLRRSGTTSSVNRGTSSGTRSGYTPQSTSRSSSGSVYNRPSSTRSSSSSSSRSGGYTSSSSSSSSRSSSSSSSYSSSRSSSSYSSSSSSYSGSSYSGGSSYSSSRSGGSYSGGSSSRSGGSSGSRR